MSTRCVINFTWDGHIDAKVYRHSDGYPDGVLPDLQKFFVAVEKQTDDRRFHDPSFLAAKFIVWQADQLAKTYDSSKRGYHKSKKLDFIGVGVVTENPDDIEYEYMVACSTHDEKGRPIVTVGRPQ